MSHLNRFHPVALACVTAGLSAAPHVHAIDFELESGLKGSFNSSLASGMTVRTGHTKCEFVGQDNGGCASNDQVDIAAKNPSQFNQSYDLLRLNQDDGNLNYRRGQVVSATVRGVHDLQLSAGNGWSGLLRASWYYDGAVDRTDRTQLDSESRHQAVRDIRFLDAYVTKDFDVGDRNGRLRFGNQVLSWGEATFIPGGINAINAIDVTKTHSPGAELKEIQLPAPILSMNLKLAKGVALESYYQFGWNAVRVDPVGTFFSTSDVAGRGSAGIFLATSLGNAIAAGAGLPASAPPGTTGDTGTQVRSVDPVTGAVSTRTYSAPELADPTSSPYFGAFGTGSAVARGGDQRARNQGQFGTALRFTLPDSGDEAALFALRYHDKVPSFSIRVNQAQTSNPFAWDSIYAVYPENKWLFGASYSTRLADWSVGGEVSYRPRETVAIDPTMVIDPTSAYYCNGDLVSANYRPTGYVCRGDFQTRKIQVHLTALNLISPGGSLGGLMRLLGASEGTFLGELAIANYPSLQMDAGVPYAVTSDYKTPTRTSSGLVSSLTLVFPSAFGTRVTLSPDVTWSYGLSGYSASALPGFVEGAGAVTIGVTADLKTQPSVRIRGDFTHNYGGGLSNLLRDRDFMTLSLVTSF